MIRDESKAMERYLRDTRHRLTMRLYCCSNGCLVCDRFVHMKPVATLECERIDGLKAVFVGEAYGGGRVLLCMIFDGLDLFSTVQRPGLVLDREHIMPGMLVSVEASVRGLNE
jgi:hypothetical protein